MTQVNTAQLPGWERLRHGGLLLDPLRLLAIAQYSPPALSRYHEQELRRHVTALLNDQTEVSAFVSFVLGRVCGFDAVAGSWVRGTSVGAEWTRRTASGETIKPRQIWSGECGAIMPIFIDSGKQKGAGLARRTNSHVVQWLRSGNERLALLTNGRQWRLIFAGLDFDAWCEWDVELWLEEGALAAQVDALRVLIQPALWSPAEAGQQSPLLTAILDSRKGQAELSAALGERVREAVETLVQAHGDALSQRCSDVDGADIYRAAVRVVMRMVVVMFAESRDLLPRDNALYHAAYGIGGLVEELSKSVGRGGNRRSRSYSAWPRILALFRLVHQGSYHPALPVPAYGGELFAPADGNDGLSRALHVFETAAFDTTMAIVSDQVVWNMVEKISRTSVRIRQGVKTIQVPVPVDFSDLSSEYIGILYEGLLDFELKTAKAGDPVIFLAVGNQPALPLTRLEGMQDKELKELFEKMKDTSSKSDDDTSEDDADAAADEDADNQSDASNETDDELDSEGESGLAIDVLDGADDRSVTRTRAEQWARRAVEVGKLVAKPGSKSTPERLRAYEEAVAKKAKQLITRVVLPGEWYLVRWGGTRKGSGTFYTRPGLAVPTVHRTLRPLAYNPPTSADGTPNVDAPPKDWLPKAPEEILAVKTCDPACGSGTFPVSSLRFLTDALYAAVHHHGRVLDQGDRSVVHLLGASDGTSEVAPLAQEMIPCVSDDPSFESRLKAVLKRHVVERCIYGVDIDPLAVELCRLALWIETMDRSLPFSFLDHKIKCGNGLVGAWFDQFLHYPVMAWKNREGGDKGHSNGVHFTKDERGKALREFATGRLREDLHRFLSGPTLFDLADLAQEASNVHNDALALLNRLHDLPVHDAAERSRIYREELLGSPAYRQLKNAMDLWCACWFWPAEAITIAPLPSTFSAPSSETIAEAERIALQKRFFHWELEFPDVFRTAASGFDAIIGNPPWETMQPNPEEFFSNYDPLFRTYGRLVKNERLKVLFTHDAEIEHAWLEYSADFNSISNWVTHASNSFGDPIVRASSNSQYPIARGTENSRLHSQWRALRKLGGSYSDSAHPFIHQTGRMFTYKLFLELSHALLRNGGRMGQIVPSGVYSDAWSQPLRTLFLDQCQWEWLFGFENRDKVFDIHRSFKFNPVIITKGGTTSAIRTAFMRRKLEDWERAEEFATPYARAQVDQFSPRSQAILEIQSKRDLEILEKIYANSVLLGDDGPDGWGVKYKLEFMMNTDAHLFPPRTKWEEQGYRPDEYSRWLKGDWRPIAELWPELSIDPTRVVPNDITLEDWLFDSSAGPERRTAEAQFVHGHLLKPGDVARTNARLRCAQPPYDSLPIPRADIPAGIILSREADAWIRKEKIEDVALPLYEGKSIWIHDWAFGSDWHSMRHANAVDAAFLLGADQFSEKNTGLSTRVVFRDITNSTNTRSMVSAVVPLFPCGNGVPILSVAQGLSSTKSNMVAWFGTLTFDWVVRQRLSGSHINWHIAEPLPLPRPQLLQGCKIDSKVLDYTGVVFSIQRILSNLAAQDAVYYSVSCRTARTVSIDALAAIAMNFETRDLQTILIGCDAPRRNVAGHSKGFWRVDKDKDPELRHTVLTLIAFHDLQRKIDEHGGDRDKGIEAFLNQNNGEGWMLPEMLRLADYGLGHDDRALEHQPVASRLGPRFYDWQLVQTADESWRECHLHARNMLGVEEYQRLLDRIEAEKRGEVWEDPNPVPASKSEGKRVNTQAGQLGMEI